MDFWDTVKTKYLSISDHEWKEKYFLRNPKREIKYGDINFLSPADGTILYFKEDLGADDKILDVKGIKNIGVRDITQMPLDGRFTVIGLFLSFWDVHFQRMPTRGLIRGIRIPCATKNHSMVDVENRLMNKEPTDLMDINYIFNNERAINIISANILMKRYSYILVQIADEEVNAIDLFYEPDTELKQGQHFGLIKFGSQVDILLPHPLPYPIKKNYKVGDHVEAGCHILFNWVVEA